MIVETSENKLEQGAFLPQCNGSHFVDEITENSSFYLEMALPLLLFMWKKIAQFASFSSCLLNSMLGICVGTSIFAARAYESMKVSTI